MPFYKIINLIFSGIGLFQIYFFSIGKINIIWLLLTVLFWFFITAMGSYFVSWQYFVRIRNCHSQTVSKHIAITFDDGPHPIYTLKVLKLLAKHQCKATFFCIGKQLEKHPEIATKIINEGHQLGNHSYTHNRAIGFYGCEKMIHEIEKTDTLLRQIDGSISKIYRPPFGVTNPALRGAVQKTGHQIIGWNKRSYDTTPISISHIIKRVTTRLKPGDIILLHDKSEKTLQVLEQLLVFIETKKIKSVTIDQLGNPNNYA